MDIKLVHSTNHLKNKFLTLINFIKFIETNLLIDTCKIYGSFVRQLFEKMFISSYDETGYGDSENHDVDMTIFDSEESYINNKEQFYTIIELLENLQKIENNNITFNNYIIKKIYDLTLNCDYEKRELQKRQERIEQISVYLQNYQPIYNTKVANLEKSIRKKFNGVPHFHIILYNIDDDTYIIIDLLGYPISDTEYNINDDIDVNTLYITKEGIKSKFDFFTTIESIIKHRGILKMNIESMKNDLETKSLTFNEKSRLYNNIVNFIGLRTKILANGYNQIESDKKIIDIYLEKNNICEITDLHPPYIKINLDCSHSISIMALAGLVNIQNNEYTEYIGCPFCREKLLPKMIINNISQQIIPDKEAILQIIENKIDSTSPIINIFNEKLIPKPTINEIMSQDNINNILENMGYNNYDNINNNTNLENQYDNQYDNQYENNYDNDNNYDNYDNYNMYDNNDNDNNNPPSTSPPLPPLSPEDNIYYINLENV